MDTLEIVIIAVVVVVLLLSAAGYYLNRRRAAATDREFHVRVAHANRDLAAAHAADNGWEPSRLEAAARRAFAERKPQDEITSLTLVQVVDPPGTADDKAVFRVEAHDHAHRLALGRRGDEWVVEDLR